MRYILHLFFYFPKFQYRRNSIMFINQIFSNNFSKHHGIEMSSWKATLLECMIFGFPIFSILKIRYFSPKPKFSTFENFNFAILFELSYCNVRPLYARFVTLNFEIILPTWIFCSLVILERQKLAIFSTSLYSGTFLQNPQE